MRTIGPVSRRPATNATRIRVASIPLKSEIPAATPMILASRRLTRKRLLNSTSRQAMSEVAVLTRSIAVMKAPARAVAVSRLAEKVANIVLVPFFFGPPWAMPTTMQGPCQFKFI